MIGGSAMTVVQPAVGRRGLVERVKNILLQPAREWEVIDGEPASIGGLYTSYVAPLAAIPAICSLIGLLVFGLGALGFTYKPPLGGAVTSAVVGYLLSLAGVFVLALIIEFLAPNFGGKKDRLQAFKVAAYASTASWVAGILTLLPALAVVAALLGLYSLYLLYTGLPRLMKTPQDKALPYTAVVIVAAVVIFLIIGLVTAPLRMMGAGPMGVGGGGSVSGNVSLPGVGNVNLGELEAAAERMERAADTPATSPEVLAGLLPSNVSGMARGATSNSSAGVEGLQGSTAEATYGAGESTIKLSVTDLGAMGGLASLGGALNIQSSEDDGNRYAKTGKQGDRLVQEEYDRAARSGSYSVIVGERFAINAEGEGVDINQLKQAVNSVNAGQLERMAR